MGLICVLMARMGSFGVSPYKYWRAVGVNRVRSAVPGVMQSWELQGYIANML